MKSVCARASVAGIMALAGLLAFGASNAWAKGAAAKPAAEKAAPAKPKAKPKAKEKDKDGIPEADAKIWALRDHYTFGGDDGKIYYAVEDAEWTLDMPGLGNVTDNVGFRITFADGTNWEASALGKGESVRQTFSDDLGNGTTFTSQFPAKDGVVVCHSMSIYKDRPFILVRIVVGNVGDKPIEIKKLCPVVLGPSGIGKLSPDTQTAARRLKNRGGHAVFDKAAPPVLTVLDDVAHKFCLSFGVVPGGLATSSAELARGADCWQGEVDCAYSPSIRVDPGQKLPSDPAWLTYRTAIPSEIDQNYAWVASRIPHADMHKNLPRSWVAVDKGEPESKLIETVKAWSGAGVKYALVPENWEGRPGSMEGCTPAYPKDMAKTAKQLTGLGMQPGLTIDPLLTTAGNDEWAVSGTDGARWVNLSNPEGRKHAVERLKKAVAWGYQFFAVPPSNIPDEALRHFNLTRAQADVLAMQTMQEAAEGRPTAATSACALNADLKGWLEAAAATGRMAEFGVSPGPVRFAVNDGASVDNALLAVLTMFSSPIEYSGKPSADVAKAVSQLCDHGRMFARPIDSARLDPKLWLAAVASVIEGVETHSIVAFPGAPGWTMADLALDKASDMIVWDASTGMSMDAANAVSNGNNLTVYGVSPKPAHPALLGASDGPRLLLDDLKAVTWKEDKGT
ncbi:MAG: hypothetical protein NTU83_09255, partial [Candidatus Hydrogenedentes bacterium]|nr:hypothetical protein [Candidatus Hydrogenedentota bacterium]